MLKNIDINHLRIGMRVQSFTTRHEGEIALVDVPLHVVWIKWSLNHAMVPHLHRKLDDVFTIDH